jgi:ribosome biogenesis GTPase
LILDTPGMRELGLVDDAGLGGTFSDIDELAAGCRFSDCGHGPEPGCAVTEAIRDGSLPSERLDSRRKLEREARRAQAEQDPRARAEERRRHRAMSAAVASHMRRKYGEDR